MNIYQKLIEVRKEVPYLQKENTSNQYKYVSSSQVLSNCKKKMDELGLLLVPAVTGHKVSESTVEQFDKDSGHVFKRTTTYFTELDMAMTWVNAEKPDETISCPWYGQGVDIAGEKGVGKAMTYAEKYFMLKFFNIPTDKDDPDHFQDKVEKTQNSDTKPTTKPAPATKPAPTTKPATTEPSRAAHNPPQASGAPVDPNEPTKPMMGKIWALSQKMKLVEAMPDIIAAKCNGKKSSKELTKKEASALIDYLLKLESGEEVWTPHGDAYEPMDSLHNPIEFTEDDMVF